MKRVWGRHPLPLSYIGQGQILLSVLPQALFYNDDVPPAESHLIPPTEFLTVGQQPWPKGGWAWWFLTAQDTYWGGCCTFSLTPFLNSFSKEANMFYDPHVQRDPILVSWGTFMIFLIDIFYVCHWPKSRVKVLTVFILLPLPLTRKGLKEVI